MVPNRVYRCEVRLISEELGGFTVYVPALPGAVSCGDTVEEALTNIAEALEGVIESYLAAPCRIPWVSEISSCPVDEETHWVLVHA